MSTRWACCLFACLIALAMSADLERKRKKCMRAKHYKPVRQPFDINDTLKPLLDGEYDHLGPKVLSTDPWIVYFENFMTEEEVSAIEQNLFYSPTQDFMPSPAGGGEATHQARHSETAFCTGTCDQHETVQNVRARAGKIVNVPPSNFDFSQALRYKNGMYYKTHHDNHPTFHYLPSGARIWTYFVYLSDAGLEGGATYFPKVDIRAPAKRGSAVVFQDTLVENPMRSDLRTEHESEVVTKGEKRGMNMWLYQYEYRRYWEIGCTTIDLADELGRYGKSTAPVMPTIIFQNNLKEKVYVVDVPDRDPDKFLGVVEPGGEFSVQSTEGNYLEVRDSRKRGAKVLKAYHVSRPNSKQRIHIGKKPKDRVEL